MARTDKIHWDGPDRGAEEESSQAGSASVPENGHTSASLSREQVREAVTHGPAGATMALSKPYKVCKVCGRVFPTRRQYLLETEPVRNNPEFPDGHMPAVGDEAYYYELRNCPCGATLVEKLRSERDRSPLGQLRRAMFADLMDGYMVRHGIGRDEARQVVLERYEAFFRAHMSSEANGGGEKQHSDIAGVGSSASEQPRSLLVRRGLGTGRDEAAEQAIWETFGGVRGLFVLDTSGFSRRTKSQGIVHFLALIYEMRERVIPILEGHGAQGYWFVADNVMAVFPDGSSALRGALAVQRNQRIVNAGRREADRLEVGIGVGHGKVLVIGEENVFGDEMNLASKLGEDVAQGGQILLTESAYRDAGEELEGMEVVPKTITVSGVEISYFEVVLTDF